MKNLTLFAVSIVVGVAIIWAVIPKSSPVITNKPKAEVFSFSLDDAPPASLKGNITGLSGEVLWKSRTATAAAIITVPQMLQQGEEMTASASGKASIVFTNALEITMPADSQMYVAQALPVAIVLQQSTGEINYHKLGATPISVRSLHALVEILGNTTILVADPLMTITGPAKVAFNNLQNVSQIRSVSPGGTFVFNDSTRRGR